MTHIQLYVMDKAVMNEKSPWPNDRGPAAGLPAYHDITYTLATATTENPNPGQIADFLTPEEVLGALERVRGRCDVIIGKHPLFPHEVNIQGDVEKYRGTTSDMILKGLKERGIEYRQEYS